MLLQQELRKAGRETEARAEAIRSNYQAEIDAAMQAGNLELARILKQIQRGAMDMVKADGGRGGYRDVGRDRLIGARPDQLGTGAGEETRVKDQDKVVSALQSIDKKVSYGATFA